MNPDVPPVLVTAEQSRVLRAFGEEVHMLLDGEQTGGRFCQFLAITPPGGGPPPHRHSNEDEWFYVLEGRVTFYGPDGASLEVGPGASSFNPKNGVHTFKNTGDTPSKMLITASPAGFDRFFAASAEEFSQPTGPNPERLIAIAAAHGIEFV